MIDPHRLPALTNHNDSLRHTSPDEMGSDFFVLLNENIRLACLCRDKDEMIAALLQENADLKRKLAEAAVIREEELEERIGAEVDAATKLVMEKLEKAHEEIKRLGAIINKNSTNSSKPPRTDGFKRQVKNSREKSGRPRGGQKGHPGHRLGLPENLDELVKKGTVERELIDHTDGRNEYVSRYVIDIKVLTTVTEHRFAVGDNIPANLYNEVSYGENVKALCVYLITEGIIAEKRMSDILYGLTHGVITISPATIERFQSQFAQKLVTGGELDAIVEDLLNGEVISVDDTTMSSTEKVEYIEDGVEIISTAKGKSFNACVRVYTNEDSAFYTANPQKDGLGVERDGILPVFHKILSHDHEAKFYNYGAEHATCWAHLVRELKGLSVLACVNWASQMRNFGLEMNDYKNKDLEGGKTACDPVVLVGFEQRYDELLKQGWERLGIMSKLSWCYKPLENVLKRLEKYKDCYMLFIRNYKAPFTNNLAERDLRYEKTKEKISYLFRSWAGLKTHVKIRSFFTTLKKRGMDVFAAVVQVNDGISVLH